MIFRKIDKFWRVARSVAIGFFVLGSIVSVITCHSCTCEDDRWNSSDRENRERENKEAFDRVREGSTKEKDFERAREHERRLEPDHWGINSR
jgi:hypothetical protein